MTITTIINPVVQLTSLVSKLFHNILKNRAHRKMVRTTTRELSGLTDRELYDLGISRGQIYSIARGDIARDRLAYISGNPNLKGWI
jgi:uncharacterized protein YjiS (DUF1127 family)